MKTLVIIPARGGSKGLPGKNIKELNGKPLIHYSIETARSCFDDQDICVSTDDTEIVRIVEQTGLKVPFLRPSALSGDNSGSNEVLLHALNFYEKKGVYYDTIILLQPTSPFRTKQNLEDVLSLYASDVDMVVSVGKSHQNPFNFLEENSAGYLQKIAKIDFTNRQNIPPVYFYNGSIYLINVQSIKKTPIHKFEKIRKYLMDEVYSHDIDTLFDWAICETLIQLGYVDLSN